MSENTAVNEPEPLSTSELEKARRRYYIHNTLNAISFRLLAGGIITLYAIRLGAGNTFVGMLSSIMYLSMAFLLGGRPLAARIGVVRNQVIFWTARYILMIPAVASTLPGIRSNQVLALTLLAIGVFGFHTSKGIALAGQRVILGMIAGEKDRGVVLSRIQTLNTIFSTTAWLLLGLAMGEDAPFGVYTVTFTLGIIFGVGSALALKGLPEPQDAALASKVKILSSLRDGWKNEGFRKLISLTFVKNFLLAMTGSFLIVQFKRVLEHTDSGVVYITLIGGMGVIVMAALAGLLMDKVGARPLFFAFTILTALSLFPITLTTPQVGTWIAWLVPCGVFFLYNMGAMGMENCAQDYFFATARPEERLNLGIFIFIASGLSGAAGAILGGLILDGLIGALALPADTVFRVYFAAMQLLFLGTAYLVSRLPNFGAYSIMNTVSILFSPRNLRAFRLLRRLDQSKTADEEQQAIRALAGKPSAVSVEELLRKLKSPSFAVRNETLATLRGHPPADPLKQALIDEVRDHHYTTAWVAAEILGNQIITESVEVLREAIRTEDFMLCGKAMVSLAKLEDTESIPAIVSIFKHSENPRTVIHACRAFSLFGDPALISPLLERLEPRIAPFVRDEIILAVSELSGMGDWFFTLFSLFLEKDLAGTTELRSLLNGRYPEIRKVVGYVTADPDIFARAVDGVLQTRGISVSGNDLTEPFSKAISNTTIVGLVRFRFLIAALLVRQVLSPPK